MKFYLDKNHIYGKNLLNDQITDYGYYSKTIKSEQVDRNFQAIKKYTDQYGDMADYQIVRYYTEGVEADGCRRFSLIYLKCAPSRSFKIISKVEIDKIDLPTDFNYNTCGYIFRAQVDCVADMTVDPPYYYEECETGKTCTLTDGEGILSTHCV